MMKTPKIFVAILCIFALTLCACASGGGYEAALEKYIDAYFNRDAESIMKLIHEYYVDDAIEMGEIYDRTDLQELIQRELDWYNDCAVKKGGDDYEYVAEIHRIKELDLAKGKYDFNTMKVLYGDNAGRIKEGVEVTIYFTLYSDAWDGTVIHDEILEIVRIGSKWYVTPTTDWDQFR